MGPSNDRARRGSRGAQLSRWFRSNACLTAVVVFVVVYCVFMVRTNISVQVVQRNEDQAAMNEEALSKPLKGAMDALKGMGVLNDGYTREEAEVLNDELSPGEEDNESNGDVSLAPLVYGAVSMELYPNSSRSALVDSTWLRNAFGNDQLKLLLLDCNPVDSFPQGHIPHAVPFTLASSLLKNPASGATGVISENKFLHVIKWLQVLKDAAIVFYDDERSMKAVRAWWVFRHYGFPVDRIKVLDGGLKQWQADGNEVATGDPELTASAPSDAPGSQTIERAEGCEKELWSDVKDTHVLVGFKAVQQGIFDSSTQFVDARTSDEFSGKNAAGNARAGHIPGAVNFNWVNAVDADTGRFKPKAELEAIFLDELHLDKNKPVITYCQRAVRGSHVAFTLEQVLGFKSVKVYEDSMLQYLNRDDSQVEK